MWLDIHTDGQIIVSIHTFSGLGIIFKTYITWVSKNLLSECIAMSPWVVCDFFILCQRGKLM